MAAGKKPKADSKNSAVNFGMEDSQINRKFTLADSNILQVCGSKNEKIYNQFSAEVQLAWDSFEKMFPKFHY